MPAGFRYWLHIAVFVFAVEVACDVCVCDCVAASVAPSISIAVARWVWLSTPFVAATGVVVPFVCVSDLLSFGVFVPASACSVCTSDSR